MRRVTRGVSVDAGHLFADTFADEPQRRSHPSRSKASEQRSSTAVTTVLEGEEVVPQAALHLSADKRYAAYGEVVQWEWSVAWPAGSPAKLSPAPELANPTFVVNVAGPYTFTLRGWGDGAPRAACQPSCRFSSSPTRRSTSNSYGRLPAIQIRQMRGAEPGPTATCTWRWRAWPRRALTSMPTDPPIPGLYSPGIAFGSTRTPTGGGPAALRRPLARACRLGWSGSRNPYHRGALGQGLPGRRPLLESQQFRRLLRDRDIACLRLR